jgi:hypothetical protein
MQYGYTFEGGRILIILCTLTLIILTNILCYVVLRGYVQRTMTCMCTKGYAAVAQVEMKTKWENLREVIIKLV